MRVLCLGIHGTLRVGELVQERELLFSKRPVRCEFQCSRTCQGLESMLLCSKVLEVRIKRRGVWLVIPLDVKKMVVLS